VGRSIKKDEPFFFGGYEGLRSNVGNLYIETAPAIAGYPTPDPKNSMVDAIKCAADRRSDAQPHQPEIAGLHLGANRLHRRAHRGANPSTTTYASTSATSNISDNGVGKIDYNINSKHRASGMLWIGNYLGDGNDHGFLNPLFDLQAVLRATDIVVNWI
jgi:hypothetical protein